MGMNRALVGAGGLLAAGGVLAWTLSRGAAPAARSEREVGHEDARDAPNSAGPAIPSSASGPGNLAVAWWPQDVSIAHGGGDATLRFQSTIANLGGEAVDIHPNDRVEYTVTREARGGAPSEVVGRSSARLDRADIEPFPVPVGAEVGRVISSFGVELEPIDSLGPRTAAIVGAGHASQAIELRDATKGLYVLRQQIVRADGARDRSPGDDVRLTEFLLDGRGGILHTSSRYAG